VKKNFTGLFFKILMVKRLVKRNITRLILRIRVAGKVVEKDPNKIDFENLSDDYFEEVIVRGMISMPESNRKIIQERFRVMNKKKI